MTGHLDLASLLQSWDIALPAERKSPSTIKTYLDGVGRYLPWCERTGRVSELS